MPNERRHKQSLTHLHPFSSDQMIRNLSMKIGDVGLGSIELCAIAWRATARILGTPCLVCDRLFTGVVVNSRAKGTAGDPARCLCMQPPSAWAAVQYYMYQQLLHHTVFVGLFLVELITVDIIPVDLIIVGLTPVDINDVEAILEQVILCRP